MIYTIIILGLCLGIFFKTKEMYMLTKHRGIQLFRYTFLFLGIAHAIRFFLHTLNLISYPSIEIQLFLLITTAYTSTVALFFLLFSTCKKLKTKYYTHIAHMGALFTMIITLITHSTWILILTQGCLFIAAILGLNDKYKTLHMIYLLLFSFWFINIARTINVNMMPLWVHIFFDAISIFIFVLIYYKVIKWTK